MGQAYEEKTEHLIEMFMKYSDKKSLDVNEFLKIRKQAIKETDDIVFNGTNIIRPLSDTKIPQEEKRTNINILTDVYDHILKSNDQKYLKVTVCDQSQIVFASIIKKLKAINDIDVLDVSHMSKKIIKAGTEEVLVEYCYTEITNKDVNKWTALEYIMKELNLDRNEIVAIGDNVNDKEMIEEAGLGVAMGNSTQVIKEIANVEVGTNNEDGVCETFQKYINSQF